MPFLDVGGRQIHYRDAGCGVPVLALHASSSHSGQWKPFMEAVQDRYRVIAPDLHGYGRSDPLPKDGQLFFVHDTNVVRAFVEFAGSAHLVGHSLGGATAFAAAREVPGLRSLTMIEPVLFDFLSQARHPAAGDVRGIYEDVTTLLAQDKPEEAARRFVAFWSGDGAFDAMPPHVQDYAVATMDRVKADFDGLAAAEAGGLALSDAASLDIPVHLICGTGTRASAKAIVDLLADRIPGAVRTDIPGAAHMAAATDPGLINPHIAAFLDANSK